AGRRLGRASYLSGVAIRRSVSHLLEIAGVDAVLQPDGRAPGLRARPASVLRWAAGGEHTGREWRCMVVWGWSLAGVVPVRRAADDEPSGARLGPLHADPAERRRGRVERTVSRRVSRGRCLAARPARHRTWRPERGDLRSGALDANVHECDAAAG